jgi:hypothetical protein
MIRSTVFPPQFPTSAPWFASVPSDASPANKVPDRGAVEQPHLCRDWYQARDGAGTVTDVTFDFYTTSQ